MAGCFPRWETRQHSGTVGGIALYQVAVTLTYATGRGHALIGRALYLPERCAADEGHRELAGVPDEVMFASNPQLAGALPDRAQLLGIGAAFVVGDEVYSGRELRRSIRQRGMGYVLAVRANHPVTTGSGRTMTACGLPARLHLPRGRRAAPADAGSDLDAGLIPITVPELLRLLRDIVIPPPRRDRSHRSHWSDWRRRHQHCARQARRRWNAYAEATP